MKFLLFCLYVLFLVNILASSKRHKLKKKSESKSPLAAIANMKLNVNLIHRDMDSCSVSAQFIFLTACGITPMAATSMPTVSHVDKSRPPVQLTPSDIIDNMKILVDSNQVVLMSIANEHHFVVFKGNHGRIYLIQSFQGFYHLSQWLSNDEVITPYLTEIEFFEYLKILFNSAESDEHRRHSIRVLFGPVAFTKNEATTNNIINYFNLQSMRITGIHYAPFNVINLSPNDYKKAKLFQVAGYTGW